MSEFLPCPFCGDAYDKGEMQMFAPQTGAKWTKVTCRICGGSAPTTVWNRRAPLQQETDKDGEFKTLYYELLMSVGNKYPNETRHQTALRYIINAERITGEAKAALPQKDSKI